MYTLFYNICSKTKVAIKPEYDNASQNMTALHKNLIHPYPVQGREEMWASEPTLLTPMARR
jgi:hypothetical protein